MIDDLLVTTGPPWRPDPPDDPGKEATTRVTTEARGPLGFDIFLAKALESSSKKPCFIGKKRAGVGAMSCMGCKGSLVRIQSPRPIISPSYRRSALPLGILKHPELSFDCLECPGNFDTNLAQIGKGIADRGRAWAALIGYRIYRIEPAIRKGLRPVRAAAHGWRSCPGDPVGGQVRTPDARELRLRLRGQGGAR